MATPRYHLAAQVKVRLHPTARRVANTGSRQLREEFENGARKDRLHPGEFLHPRLCTCTIPAGQRDRREFASVCPPRRLDISAVFRKECEAHRTVRADDIQVYASLGW